MFEMCDALVARAYVAIRAMLAVADDPDDDAESVL